MATSKGTMFDPTLVKDLITKVKGKSARLHYVVRHRFHSMD